MRNKFFKMLLLNCGIVLSVILCYSEGFLALRPTDASIFRAGMSIFVGIAAATSFLYGNYTILTSEREKVFYSQKELTDISQAQKILRSFHGGKNFGRIADTASDQLFRLEKTMDRVHKAIGLKFESGSMSYDRYISTIQAAREAALQNCIGMANRMQLFDEVEYSKQKTYYKDRIDDSIQEKQIALYRQNMDEIESAISANEKLILALDTMSMELASNDGLEKEGAGDPMLLDEIKKLTDQVRLYT